MIDWHVGRRTSEGVRVLAADYRELHRHPGMEPVLTRAINWDLITRQYDQVIKYARALRLGTAEAEQILTAGRALPARPPLFWSSGALHGTFELKQDERLDYDRGAGGLAAGKGIHPAIPDVH